MSVILDLVTLCEKAINTAAKLKAMRLSEEEITLLAHAQKPGQYQGQFHILEIEQGTYPIVMAAHSSFADPEDAVASARYFDAFKRLCERNLVQFASGKMFTLTSAGFEKAAKLSSEHPAATVHNDCAKLAEENAALRQELEQARQKPLASYGEAPEGPDGDWMKKVF